MMQVSRTINGLMVLMVLVVTGTVVGLKVVRGVVVVGLAAVVVGRGGFSVEICPVVLGIGLPPVVTGNSGMVSDTVSP